MTEHKKRTFDVVGAEHGWRILFTLDNKKRPLGFRNWTPEARSTRRELPGRNDDWFHPVDETITLTLDEMEKLIERIPLVVGEQLLAATLAFNFPQRAAHGDWTNIRFCVRGKCLQVSHILYNLHLYLTLARCNMHSPSDYDDDYLQPAIDPTGAPILHPLGLVFGVIRRMLDQPTYRARMYGEPTASEMMRVQRQLRKADCTCQPVIRHLTCEQRKQQRPVVDGDEGNEAADDDDETLDPQLYNDYKSMRKLLAKHGDFARTLPHICVTEKHRAKLQRKWRRHQRKTETIRSQLLEAVEPEPPHLIHPDQLQTGRLEFADEPVDENHLISPAEMEHFMTVTEQHFSYLFDGYPYSERLPYAWALPDPMVDKTNNHRAAVSASRNPHHPVNWFRVEKPPCAAPGFVPQYFHLPHSLHRFAASAVPLLTVVLVRVSDAHQEEVQNSTYRAATPEEIFLDLHRYFHAATAPETISVADTLALIRSYLRIPELRFRHHTRANELLSLWAEISRETCEFLKFQQPLSIEPRRASRRAVRNDCFEQIQHILQQPEIVRPPDEHEFVLPRLTPGPTMRCSVCRAIGHIKTNRNCPLFGQPPADQPGEISADSASMSGGDDNGAEARQFKQEAQAINSLLSEPMDDEPEPDRTRAQPAENAIVEQSPGEPESDRYDQPDSPGPSRRVSKRKLDQPDGERGPSEPPCKSEALDLQSLLDEL